MPNDAVFAFDGEAKYLNTPRQVYDDQAQLRWKWDQAEPFGVNTPDENPVNLGAFELPFRFPGQYADKESTLHQNLNRDFDSSLGIYKQSDPLGLNAGLNTYAYALASPLVNSDPDGLQVPAPGGGAVIGGSTAAAGGAIGGSAGSGGGVGSNAAIARGLQNLLNNILSSAAKTPQEIVEEAPVPSWPGLTTLKYCIPGQTHIEPATDKRWRNGGVSIDQEYQCGCGCIVRHSIVFNNAVVHDHFYPCPIKRGQPR